MNPTFSLFDLLILIGILQGIITGILLWRSKKNTRCNKFLALALFAFCFLNTKPLLHTLHLWDTNLFRYFPNGVELAITPLVYFYIKSLVTPEFRFKNKNWIHFIPFIIAQTYAFVVYFSVLTTNDFNTKDSIAKSFKFDYIKTLEEYLLLLLLPFYLFYVYKELIDYKKWLDNTTSDGTFPDFRWLKVIFQLSIIIGAFLLVNHLLDISFDLNSKTLLHYNLLTLFIAFTIYYLGFKGYLQPDTTFIRTKINPIIESNSNILNIEQTRIVEQIQKAMIEDKVFLNPKLNIYELSNMLNVPQKRVSTVINQHFKMSFRDFVNKYRLEEVKFKLDHLDYKNMSILGIALDSGFNSEASFYRIFKKDTGFSPKEFIQRKSTDFT